MNTTRPDPDASLPLAPEWYDRIASSREAHDLVMVARAFLDGWNPVDLAKLPPGARPGRIGDVEDIASVAYELAQERLRGELPRDIDRLATRMHAFFSNAAARAAALSSHRTLP
jgi:hypothetical protein